MRIDIDNSNVMWTVIGFVIVAMIMAFSSNHDMLVMQAGDRYEKCVAAEYGTTPGAYRAEHGEYPFCESN